MSRTKKFGQLMVFTRLISLTTVCLTVIYVLHFLTRIFLYDQFITPTESMKPTLIPGDRIIVDKTIIGARIYTDLNFNNNGMELKSVRTPGQRSVRTNDIVVFNYPHHNGKISFIINNVYAKRCIGTPGDSVSIVNGYFINSNYTSQIGLKCMQDSFAQLPDSYFPNDVFRSIPYDEHFPWTIKNFGPLYLPRKGDYIYLTAKEGCLYRMLLEWETEKDISIDWERNVTLANGKPLASHRFKHNYYFMCGDNVINSNDSRYWGLVPEEYIVGVVSRISYSIHPKTGKYRRDRYLKASSL